MRIGIRNTLAYTHIWVALGATFQVLYVGFFAQLPQQLLYQYACLIFFASLSFYSFHRLFGLWKVLPELPDERWKVCFQLQRVLFALVPLGGLVAFVLFLSLPSVWQAHVIVPALLSTLYALPIWKTKRVRDFGSLKPVWLAVGWAWLCIYVPLSLSDTWTDAFTLVVAERFFFILGLAIVSDNKDVDFDRSQGVNTWSVMLGQLSASYLSIFFSLISLLISLKLMIGFSGHGSYLVVLPMTSLLAILLYLIEAKRTRVHHLYYALLLDGLLLLPLLVITGKF